MPETPRENLPPEVERAANGLRVRGHGLYLEPRGRPPMGFLAHARGAPSVLPERLIATAGTIALLEAAQPRALRRTAALPAAFGSRFALGSLELSLHPAGHVLGSAQIRCSAGDLDLVYAGDLGGSGKRASLTAEKREQLSCDVLVLRAVYGHPRYAFAERIELLEKVRAFVDKCLGEGKTPVLIASALGVTQDLVRHLGALGRTLRLHPTALRACEVAVAQGLPLQRFAPLDGEGEVVVLPPTARLGRLQLGEHRTCVLSGRATPAPGADETIALTDHAGFEELIAYALASEARRVLVVHGHSEELAEALRDRGLPAQAVREHHHQLKLPGF